MNFKITEYGIKKICGILAIIYIIILCGCCNADKGNLTKETIINLDFFPEYDLALEYYSAQNYESAIIQYNYILDNINIKKRGAAEYWIKGMIGECYMLIGEYEKAEPYILEAVAEIDKTGESYYISRISQTAGDYYIYTLDYNKALNFYNKSLNYAQEKEIISANLGLANIYRNLGENQEALKYYAAAISEGEKQQATGKLVNVYFSLGIYWFRQDNLNEAELCFQQGGEYAEITWGKDDIKVAESYRYLARISSSRKDYQSAYSYCRKALDIYREHNNTYSYDGDIASLYNNMGSYNIDLKNYPASLEMFKRAYDMIRDRMDQNKELSDFYNNVLLHNIRALYNKSVNEDIEFEDWFQKNFEDEHGT